MTLKTAYLTAVAAFVLATGAHAQIAGTDAGVKAEASTNLGGVADTVGKAADAKTEAAGGQIVAATDADFKAGDVVRDSAGEVVGKVESVTAEGAVIATGKSRVQIPLTGFGKNDQGLVIAMTKAQIEAAAASQPQS